MLDGDRWSRQQSYEIDFKIAESYTLMQARSIFYTRPICVAPGVRFNTIPKVTQKTKGHHPIKATMLHKALRGCKEEDLESLYENKNVISPADKDICRFLKVLKTKKNLLLFIPVKFYFDKEYSTEEGSEQIIKLLWNDYQSAIGFRRKACNDMETFITFFFNDTFVIIEPLINEFKCIEYISKDKMPTFCHLETYRGTC